MTPDDATALLLPDPPPRREHKARASAECCHPDGAHGVGSMTCTCLDGYRRRWSPIGPPRVTEIEMDALAALAAGATTPEALGRECWASRRPWAVARAREALAILRGAGLARVATEGRPDVHEATPSGRALLEQEFSIFRARRASMASWARAQGATAVSRPRPGAPVRRLARKAKRARLSLDTRP